MSILVVLDSNQFYGDVHARRGRLTAVLSGARNGDFSVMVPRIVVDELSRQYPERLKEARRKAAATLRDLETDFNSLGLTVPILEDVDEAALASDYRRDLESRLANSNAQIAPYPDLEGLIPTAVAHKKPFGVKGQGFQDAVIWRTILEAADEAENVIFVTANTADFGDGQEPPGLARDLLGDLADRGLPAGRVRLVSSLNQLVTEIAEPLGIADVRAHRLLGESESAERLRSALESRILAAPLPEGELDLPVNVNNDPEVDSVEVQSVALQTARALDDDRLFLELELVVLLTLRMYIFKQDFYVAGEPSELEVTDFDLNDHYLEAELLTPARLTATVVTDPRGATIDVEVVGVERIYGVPAAEVVLERNATDLIAEVAELVVGREVGDYQPPQGADGNIEDARLENFSGSKAAAEEVEEAWGAALEVLVRVKGVGDVQWRMSAPSPSDLLTYSDSSGTDAVASGWLSVTTSAEPVLLLVRCRFVDGDLDEIELVSIAVDRSRTE